jgi:hypothetical protein
LNITDTTGLVRPDMANASGNYACTVATVTTLTNWDKTGYALSATGADLILKTATFSVAMADAVWEKAARTITGGTITTYTGNTPQTGDSFALIGATGSGLTSLAPAATALSSATWTGTKAGYLDIAVSSRGTGTALDAAGLRTAIGLATANLDTQLADLPTVAEMNARTLAAASYATATALATAQADLDNPNQYKATGFSTHSAADVVTALGTGTTLTAVPWNAAWDAEVQSECADALGVFWTSPATLVNLVWNELLAGHATAGSAGKTLSDGATIIIGP